jgi:two-component system chemotaxis response regulator CheY
VTSRRNINILVVDDLSSMRRLVQSALNDLGYAKVTGVGDGQSAYSRLKAGSYDLLITDWEMPGMSGVDLVRKLRAEERTSKLPVLMISSITDSEQIAEAVQAGVSGYVMVPFTQANLKDKIDSVLRMSTSTAA